MSVPGGQSGVRIGIGYDSHRFAAGRRLVLGGVEIEHEAGLEGHSDADVLTHAVIDALCGATGLGDLGTQFPDDDERWRDADSIDLLRTIVGQLPGPVLNVDASLVCEAPRIAPVRAEMERNLSDVLGGAVSVKASTNEGMGWIGRGEGIACVAVALVDTGPPVAVPE
jgi:2-C-methyl-D-erythritol 2,4-cyclodiphosphate synthase